MHGLFAQITANADGPAIVLRGGGELTYGQLDAQLRSLAASLRAAGIRRGDSVAVVLPEGPAAAIATLAVMSAAACAPINPAYGEVQLRSLLEQLKPAAVLIAAGDRGPAFVAARSLGLRTLELVVDAEFVHAMTLNGVEPIAPANVEPPSPADTALLLFTSGTVARPKLVPLTHGNLIAAARSILQTLALTPADRCLGVMPLYHIHGLSTLFATLVAGGSFVPLSPFTPESFFDALQTSRPTWYSASPTIHRVALDNRQLFAGDLKHGGLRFVRSASAPMPPSLIDEIERAFGAPFIEAYGMTEAAPQIASNRLPPETRKRGSVGFAAGPEVGVMDDAGVVRVRNSEGEIVVRGPNVMSGYLDDPDANRAAFVDGWLRTGDLGLLDRDGHLFVTGRLKEIINRGGEKISPRKIDDVLAQHPAVAQAVAFALQHAVLGENVAAVVVLKQAASDRNALIDNLRAFAARQLAPFEVPHEIILVDAIPLGPAGKVVRNSLAELLGLSGRQAEASPPRTPTERRIAQIFTDVLKSSPPGIHDDFFALGGHSLAATQVIARLRQTFRVSLPPETLFHQPTIAHLARAIGDRLADLAAEHVEETPAPAELATTAAASAPLSFAQEQLYFVDQIGAGNAYNVSASLRLSGALDTGVLARCLDEIVRRHASLRTTFHFENEKPIQRIDPSRSIDLPTIDLATVESAARDGELHRLAAEHAATKFDLEAGPLMRASLVRLTADDHVLLLHVHHIVFDGWSIGVLNDELRTLYAAFIVGQPSPLEPLSIQFADVAARQRDPRNDAEITRQIGYWKDQLRDAPDACTFPADRARPAVQTYRGAAHRVPLDRALVDRLRDLSRAEGVTPFMTFLAAFQTLLFRWNGQEDCLVGAPIANRPLKEHESLIGFFANTLVLRTSLTGNPTFAELLGRVRATALGTYAHQDVPLEKLVSEVHTARDASHTPLFQVMFAFQNLPHAAGDGSIRLTPTLTAKPHRIDGTSAKFDLTLYLHEADGGMTATWQYNVDLFDPKTVERIAEQFLMLLEAIAVDPRRPIAALPLMSDAQRRQIEVDWNSTQTRRVHRRSFLELFDAQVKRSPDAPAVIDANGTLSYRALDRRATQIALRLKDAIALGTLVAVCLPRSADHVAALLAVWKAGGAFLPLDPHYPPARTAFMLADAGVQILLTNLASKDRLAEQLGAMRTLCIDDIPVAESTNVDPPFALPAADALAYVIYTSGTTGRPKGVMITHGNVCHYAQSMAELLGLTPADRYLHTASFAFSSSARQFAVPLACGAAVVIAPANAARDPHALFTFARDNNSTVIDLVPSLWTSALHVVTPADMPATLRLALSASEPLPTRIASAWRSLFGPNVRQFNLFGQTETTGIVSAYEIPRDDTNSSTIVPIGRPIANTQLYVLDAAGNLVPPGMTGELHVAGAGVGRGYLGKPELTAERFIANPFTADTGNRLYRTGDMARYRDDGVIEVLGRADGQIKIRGYRVEPAEIEAVAAEHAGVAECVVVIARDESPSRLVAFVTPADVDTVALRVFLKSRLPDYMVPATIFPVKDLRRTPNGKIDRAAMAKATAAPREAAESKKASRAPAPALAEAQTILTEIWKSVLHRERVGLDENFFDLGGNSLLSINVVVRAKEAGLTLTLAQLYQNQTIAQLSAAISGGSKTPPVERRRTPRAKKVSDHDAAIAVTAESLRAYGIEALTKAGLEPTGAAIVTEVQLEASLRGQPTHNVVSIPRYAKRLLNGKINAKPVFTIDRETPFSASLDGDNGPGQWVSTYAMDLAIRKAKSHGIGMVAVRRSNHFGAAGQYVWQAAEQGLIGLCTTNGPVILAPTGGVTPTFGNNPVGVGIPAGRHFPILLDIAMSVAPRGRIGLAVAEGKPLPPGWILDKRGRPSTDLADLAAGLGVPIGGHKGYGLALVMEVLSGALTGAGFCADHHRDKLHGSTNAPDYGHFFMVIDPKLFIPAADFGARVDEIIRQAKSGPLAEGADEILIPGEMELRARKRSLEEGVRLRPSTLRALLSYAKDAKLEATLEVIDQRPPRADAVPSKNDVIPFDRSELEGTIDARFKRVVAAVPTMTALSDGVASWTYAELDRRCDDLAALIRAKVEPGRGCVAYLVEHSADMVVCALATIRAGKAYVCIHPRLPAAAQREIVLATRPELLIASAARRADAAALASADCALLSLDDAAFSGTGIPACATASDPAVIFSTSGSTGRPKCVVKSHRAVLHRAWLSAQYDNVRPGDRQSLLTSCSFASSEADVFGALLNGASVELFDVAVRGLEDFAAWIDEQKLTLLHPPVVLFRRFLKSLDAGGRFPSVRLVALAGEAVTAGDVRLWRERFGSTCALRHRFSSSEAGHIAVACIEPGDAIDGDTLPPVGAVTDKRIAIVDEVGTAVPPGVEGELVVTSAFLSDGYWRDDAATARAFSDSTTHAGERSFRTGDIGKVLLDGRFEFVGRRDDQVKIRGYRVELREIEQALVSRPDVKEVAVIAERHEDESRLVAFIAANGTPPTPADLRSALEAQLPAWKVPAEFVAIDALPLTLTGKVDRQALLKHRKSLAHIARAIAGDQLFDSDATAAQLRAIWQQLLGRADIGPDDAFLDVGGHSLLAVQMTLEIKRALGRAVPPSALVAAPTIRKLAELIARDRLAGADAPLMVQLKSGDARPPLICLPPLFGSPLTYGPLSRQIAEGQAVYALRIDDEAPQSDLDRFAEYFAARVRQISARGPYRLCGHSFGGVLAYEIARKLVSAGERVELLALFDAQVPRARRLLPAHRRLGIQLGEFAKLGPRGMARQVLKPLRSHPAQRDDSAGDIPATTTSRQRMFRSATLGRYDGTVTLFRARQQQSIDRYLEELPFNGWDALCDRVEIRHMPGDHLSMMQPPNLAALARSLNDVLAQLDVAR